MEKDTFFFSKICCTFIIIFLKTFKDCKLHREKRFVINAKGTTKLNCQTCLIFIANKFTN